ncbi:1-aminocyclopropane-1-carboxylate deaminase/D-cysteine desulfhydrase [Anaerostipes sp.]|uniref:1-aminocyclopropane-1-carboxylate deaminase/D-cysteine desulfhydrase n=1 Tax=Anaerostipes sp. TaxID=1872530 RepID=UPI0025BB692A|nr:pyridoxal-phosphate dependent enzyme [Anaerostipes sp.]MBS7007112.1 pyridoxal-phosphate dependent enzyme [Anaerostipes sp.]
MCEFKVKTPIYKLNNSYGNNVIYIKREDQIPLSFGGNKARKAILFFQDIEEQKADCVVTYGSSSSNHCRIIANMAAAKKMPCVIISPEEEHKTTNNSCLMELFGAEIRLCSVTCVKETIDNVLYELKRKGLHPYFIQGGGHGRLGTQAYINAYSEIAEYEIKNDINFDYIFHASGTGTTQAGLICGQLIHKDYKKKIIGISIARKNPRGIQIIEDSVKEYIGHTESIDFKKFLFFEDQFTTEGYGKSSIEINKAIKEVMLNESIPLDPTYTGKAFYGMQKYMHMNNIEQKKVLFIHTGGTPLFFDWLRRK